MIKRILLSSLLIASGLALQGCDDSEVAFSAGVVGGAVIAGAYYDDYYGRPRYYSSCYNRYDGYYYCRHNGRWHRWNRWYDDYDYSLMSSNKSTAVRSNRVANVAKKYGMSTGAARQIIQAFDRTKADGKLNHLRTIGLSDKEIKGLRSGRTPQAAGIAAKLKTSKSSMRKLMRDISNEYSLQKQYNFRL